MLRTLSGLRSEATPLTYAAQFSESNRCGVIRAAILSRKIWHAWPVRDSRSGSMSVLRSRCPGHEEEHYGPCAPPSSQNGLFRSGLGHSGRSGPFLQVTAARRQEHPQRPGRPPGPQETGTTPRCRATIPPLRFRYWVRSIPASRNQPLSSSCPGHSRIDSARYS